MERCLFSILSILQIMCSLFKHFRLMYLKLAGMLISRDIFLVSSLILIYYFIHEIDIIKHFD